MDAVAEGLRRYRDGANPENEIVTDTELASRLGVSKSTLSKYLRCKLLIGGEPLRRMFTDLGIAITYRDKEISARDFNHSPKPAEQPLEQVSFVFDSPYRLGETTENVAVTLERRQPQQSQTTVHIKIA
jgi:transcriptional regulator with XRE-family HTH domain